MSTATTKKRDWGLFFTGILLIICAFVVILMPGATLVSLAMIAGAILLCAGAADLVFYFRFKATMQKSIWVLINGILDILLGGMFLIHPIATAAVLPWMAGVFVIFYGAMAIASSFAFRGLGSAWLLVLLNGLLSIWIGFMFIVEPSSFALFLGIYLAMRGALMCVSGLVAPRAMKNF